MYLLLADTYNLNGDERILLSDLGLNGRDEDAGTVEWMSRVAGGERFDTLDSLCQKLDAYPEQLMDFGLWFANSQCPVPIPNVPAALACPPQPKGCRRTMASANFPFWPVDERCCDCIRDKTFGPQVPMVKQQMAAAKLREMLRAASAEHVNVPHISQVTGGLVTLLGGVNGLTKAWYAAIQAVSDKPDRQLTQFNAIARMIQACNEMSQQEESALDRMSDEQLEAYTYRLLMRRLSADQISKILGDSVNVPQSDIAKLEYGKAS